MCREFNLVPTPKTDSVVYYADRASVRPSDTTGGMVTWRKRLFAFMMRNSQRAVEFYKLPPGNSVELGIQVEL
jgi:KUP system potassium uptake protein